MQPQLSTLTITLLAISTSQRVMATESSTCDDDIKSFDVTSLSQWLAENGIPEEFCQKFEGTFCARLLRLIDAWVLNRV